MDNNKISGTKEWNTNFTDHALLRLNERVSMTPEALGVILDNDEVVSLGTEAGTSRDSKLFFSKDDDKFFIAVQDMKNGYVITILTLEYWHNLSEKHFLCKRIVSKDMLIRAVTISDQDNPLIHHPPIMGKKVVNFSLRYHELKEDLEYSIKTINGGSIDIDLFFSTPSNNIINVVRVKFQEKLQSKGTSEGNIYCVDWGIGENKVNGLRFYGAIDYLLLINAVKNDIYLRKSLSKKYDDFLEILRRQKKNRGDML